MPSIEANIKTWTAYRWQRGGDEWSGMWGGSDYEWWGSIFPRVHEFLPTGTLLEIAPGYGRWTRYLVHLCDRLIGVDLAPNCVESCKELFAGFAHTSFHANDGVSLEAVSDNSIDFAFSFDSLVHADGHVLERYVHELARKLKPDGVAFIHHSNAAYYHDQPKGSRPPRAHAGWRGNMSARLFENFCADAKLSCVGQELVNWATDALNDCFSLVARPGSRFDRPNRVRENPGFMEEAARLKEIAGIYGQDGFPGIEPTAPTERAARLLAGTRAAG